MIKNIGKNMTKGLVEKLFSIALGHPLGSAGLRIIVTMYYEMEGLGLTLGGAFLCVGGGPAMASLWTREI